MWLCLYVGRQFEDSIIENSCCIKPKVLLLVFWKSDNTQIEFDHDDKDKEDWKDILSSVFALMCKTQLRISMLLNVIKNLTINMIVVIVLTMKMGTKHIFNTFARHDEPGEPK